MLRSRLQIPAYVNVRLNRPPYTFFEDYIDLQYVDVVFICSMNMEVKAHRLVLASASPFLKELLMTSNQEIIYISVPDVNHRILKRLLNYLYVGVTKVKESDLASLKDVLSLLQIHLPSVNVSSEIPPPLVPISGINEQRGAIFVENGECSAQTAEQQNANVTSGKRSMNCPDSNKRFKPSTLSTVPANQGEDSGIFEAMCTQMIESFISTEKAVVEVPAAFSDSSGTKSGYVPQDPLDISSVEGDSASDFTATQNNVAGMKTEKTDDMEDMPLGYIDSTSDTVDEQSELCDFKPETEAVIIKSEKTYIEEGDIIPVLEPEVSLPDTELDESATDLAFDSCVDSTSELQAGDPATLEEYGEISGLSEETTELSTDMQDSEVLILNGNKSSAASGSATKNQKSDEFVKTHLPDECGYPQYECTICTKKFKTLRSTRYHISRTHQICNKHNVPVSQCKHPKTKRKPSSSKVPSPENKCEGVSSSNNPL